MKLLLAAFCVFFCGTLLGQPFKPDITGHVSGNAFIDFCNRKQYSLVGTFDSLPGPKKGMAAQVVKNGAWIYLDLNGREFTSHDDLAKHYDFYVEPERYYYDIDPDYDIMEEPLPVVYPVGYKYTGTFTSNGKYGYKYQDKILIQPEYDHVQRMDQIDNFLFFQVQKNGLFGICDYQGKLITPIVYDRIETLNLHSSQCLFIVTRDKKQGILSRAGKVSLPVDFDEVKQDQNSGSVIMVKKNGMTGTVSLNGKTIVEPAYESVNPTYGRDVKTGFIVKQNDQFGYVNSSGKVVVPCEYKSLNYNENNFLTYSTETGVGAIDTSGRKVIEPIYYWIEKPVNANCFIVSKKINGKEQLGILDLNGGIIEGCQFGHGMPFAHYDKNNEIYLFAKEKAYHETGFFNVKTLKWTLPCEYRVAITSAQYVVLWKTDPDHPGEYLKGVIDNTGQFIIPPIYKNLEFNEREGLATVSQNGKYGVVDRKNGTILPFKFDSLASISYVYHSQGDRNRTPKGYFVFTENNHRGLIDRSGKITIPAIYDDIQSTAAGMICTSGKTTKIISVDGKVYNSVNFRVTYRSDGLFEGSDTLRLTGIDCYGHKDIIPRKLEKRRFDPYDPPLPEPVAEIEKPIVDKVYSTFEVNEEPLFPGGMEALKTFIGDNLEYPEIAMEEGIVGKCFVRFVIEKNGGISDVTIKKPLRDCPECDKAALRVVKKMPNWTPAKVNGETVRCEYYLPITFKPE